MINLDFWIVYTLTVFIASIIPGPSMILALSHGIKYGVKSSLATALGNTTASIIQASISVTSLGILLTTSVTLFTIIKYAGALYLIYLGIKLFKTPFHIDSKKENTNEKTNHKKLFSEAFVVAASNPKALVFFTALFPQFINEGQNNILHYTLLIVILGIIAFVCMMIYSSSAQIIKNTFNKTSLSKYFGKIIGSIFVSFGLGLILIKK